MVLKESSHDMRIYTLMQMQNLNLILRVLVSVDQEIDLLQFCRREVSVRSWTASPKNCQHLPACICRLLQIFLAPFRDRFVLRCWDYNNFCLFCGLLFEHLVSLKWVSVRIVMEQIVICYRNCRGKSLPNCM